MNYILAAILSVLILVQPVQAQTEITLPTVSCQFSDGGGPCGTLAKIINFGKTKAAGHLGCQTGGPCNQTTQGKVFKMEIEVKEGCAIEHYTWRGTGFNNPAEGHFLIWTNVTATNWQCSHTHCITGGIKNQ